jgi:hypothetical protein
MFHLEVETLVREMETGSAFPALLHGPILSLLPSGAGKQLRSPIGLLHGGRSTSA